MWKSLWKLWKVLWKRVEVRRANRLCRCVSVSGRRGKGKPGEWVDKAGEKEETESGTRYPVCERRAWCWFQGIGEVLFRRKGAWSTWEIGTVRVCRTGKAGRGGEVDEAERYFREGM